MYSGSRWHSSANMIKIWFLIHLNIVYIVS